MSIESKNDVNHSIKILSVLREVAIEDGEVQKATDIGDVMLQMYTQAMKIEWLQEQLKAAQAISTVTENSLNNAIETIRELRR